MENEAPVSPADAVTLVNTRNGGLVPFSQKKAEEELEKTHLFALLEAKEMEALQEMRGSWSTWILRCIVWIVLFDFIVVTCVGTGLMKFDGITLPIFLGESIVKVIGLALVIVGFLFSKDSFLGKSEK